MTPMRVGIGQPPWRLFGATLLVLAALTLASVAIAPRPAQAEVDWSDLAVDTRDPSEITFLVNASAPDGIDAAVVNYSVQNPAGSVGGSVRAEVDGGSDLSTTLETIGGQRYIPVGSRIVYHWEFQAADGSTERTPDESFTFLDGRYEWQTIEEDDVTVFWYADEEAAQTAMDATNEAIAEMEELLRVEMPYPVRVVVWRNSEESAGALRPRGGAFEEMVVTGGARVSVDLLHIYDALGNFEDVARHEAAHLVTHVAGDGPYTRIPSWLDEGTAVYAQQTPGGYEAAIESAISSENLIRLRAMTSPTNRADMVNIFYGQSWHTVRFMLEEWGEEPFAELFSVIQAGERTDDALEQVYGFDQDGLYNRWREHVGLGVIDYQEQGAGSSRPSPDATRAPLGIPAGGLGGSDEPPEADPAEQPDTTTDDADEPATVTDDGGGNTTTALIVLAATVLLAAGLGGLGYRLMRTR